MAFIFNTLLITALIFLPQLSCAATIAVDDSACGSGRLLAVGDLLQVNLRGNPTTGYVWEAVAVLAQLRQQSPPRQRSNSQLVGTGGITSFEFRAIAGGYGILELVSRRPWEKDKPPLNTCLIQISVQEKIQH